jgi:putative spermidine/putrescine transport system permease protein
LGTSRFASNVFFFICVFVSCAPLILLVVLTISTYWPYPLLLPEVVSLEYYERVFIRSDRALLAAITSIVLGAFVTLLTLAIAIPTGKALAHYEFWGKGFVKTLALVPLIVPAVAVTIGIQLSIIRLGLSGSFFGVTLIHTVFALPYAIRIMSNQFEIIGAELQQQAAVLGANVVFIFRRVTLPRIMPGILAAAALSFTVSLSQYITTFMIGGGRIMTITMLLIPYIQSGQAHIAAVYSVLLIAAAVLSLTIMERVVRRHHSFEGVFQV